MSEEVVMKMVVCQRPLYVRCASRRSSAAVNMLTGRSIKCGDMRCRRASSYVAVDLRTAEGV